VRVTTEEVVIEWDNITELTEELFDVTGLWRLHTLVFDHTQIMNVGKNHINYESSFLLRADMRQGLSLKGTKMAHRPPNWTHSECWPNNIDFVENGIRLGKKRNYYTR